MATCSRLLSESTLFVEENVVIPLEELYQRLNYRMEIIKQLYTKQVELLQGPSGGGIGSGIGGDVEVDEDAMMQLLNKTEKSKEDMYRYVYWIVFCRLYVACCVGLYVCSYCVLCILLHYQHY